MKPNNKHPYRPDFAPMLSDDEFMEIYANNKATFKHLQVFLSKSGKTEVGDHFLFLGKNTIGIVQLLDLDYQEEKVNIDLLDIQANKRFRFPVDVHKRDFQCMLYNLNDIRKMIHDVDKANNGFTDEGEFTDKDVEALLELDDNQPIQQL
jgi:hypothetical protein